MKRREPWRARRNSLPSGFFVFLLFLSETLCGQPRSVLIHVQQSSDIQIGRSITAFVDSAWSSVDSLTVLKKFHDEGFWSANIDSLSAENGLTSVWVSEGRVTVIERMRIHISGRDSRTDSAQTDSSLSGKRLTAAVVEGQIASVLERLEQTGFPFAAARVENILTRQSNDTLFAVVELAVDRGPRGVIADVVVEGNKNTKASTVQREARIRPGDAFSRSVLSNVRRRLVRSQLFSAVEEPLVRASDERGVRVLIAVTEGAHNTFDGIVGYVPAATPGGQGTVMGLVNVQFGNILGTGRKLFARWYREHAHSQEIELQYTEPWVADIPLNVTGKLFQRKQDSSFVKQRVDADAQLLLSDEISVGAVFSQANVFPAAGYGASVTPESKVTSFGFSLSYDTRDSRTNPRDGVLYATDYTRGTKSLSAPFLNPSSSDIVTERYTFEMQAYFSASRSQVAALELHGKSYSAPTLDVSDLFLVGGATTIRGYREGQFRGNKIAWMNLEYRFLTGGESSVFAFLDGGYTAVQGDQLVSILASETSALGYGIGIRVESPLGLLGVSIAFGKGDAFGDGKLHVRLFNRF